MTDVSNTEQTGWSIWLEIIDLPALLVDLSLKMVSKNAIASSAKIDESILSDLHDDVRTKLKDGFDGMLALTGPRGQILVIERLDQQILVLVVDDAKIEHARSTCALLSTMSKMKGDLDRRDARLGVYHELLTHDAPNFITAVYGYIQMMHSMELPRDKQLRYLSASIAQTEALNRLIDNVRSMKRLETAPVENLALLDIGVQTEDAADEACDKSNGKCAHIENLVPKGSYIMRLEPEILAAFRIILDNGIKYADAPEIAISVGPDTDETSLHLLFSDNGRGIEDDKKEFLFQRFDILDKKRKIRGSGVSLALANKIIERNRGRIWVANRVEGDHTKGSVFHIVLKRDAVQ